MEDQSDTDITENELSANVSRADALELLALESEHSALQSKQEKLQAEINARLAALASLHAQSRSRIYDENKMILEKDSIVLDIANEQFGKIIRK